MSNDGRIKVGLIGVGPWGKNILRDLRELGAEVHAATQTEESRLRAVAGGAVSVVRAVRELPADCAGYVVANRTTAHLDAVEVLLERNRPIFSEKPLATDIERIRRLPDNAERLVFVMHKWRYHPGVIALRTIVATGEFGPALGLRTYRLGGPHDHVDTNSAWVLMPHDVSIAFHLFDEAPKPVAAWRDPLAPGVDGLIARFKTASGKVDFVAEVSTGYLGNTRRIVLSCREATCELDGEHYDRIRIRRKAGAAIEERMLASDMPLKAELRAFLAYLTGGPAPVTRLKDEISMIEAIARLHEMAGA